MPAEAVLAGIFLSLGLPPVSVRATKCCVLGGLGLDGSIAAIGGALFSLK